MTPGTIRRWLWRLVVAGWLALMPSLVHAATGLVPLTACVMRDDGGAVPFDVPARRFDCTTPQATFGPGDYWVRARTVPAGAGLTLLRARVRAAWDDNLSLFARYADGRVFREALDGRDISRHLRLGAVVEVKLPDRGVPITAMLWRVKGSANFHRVLGGLELASPIASEHDNLRAGMVYAGFAGVCLALFAFNLALWVAVRQPFQLAYAAMIAITTLYVSFASGITAHLLPDLANAPRAAIAYLLMPISTVAALCFARTFIGPAAMLARLRIAIDGLAALLLIGSALFMLGPDVMRVADAGIGVALIALIVLTPPLLAAAAQRGRVFLAVFALTWAAPLMLAAMRVTNTFRLLPFSLLFKQASFAMLAVQALLSGLAIVYRIHLIARERDEARMQEMAARLLADVDPLTGLLNRRALLSKALARGGEQTLLLADLDHFRRINETIGHDGGDEVLRVVARVLRSIAATDTLVGRIGGEEFAILCPVGATVESAAILDRLRAERMPFDLVVTASIGSCTAPLRSEAEWKRLYRGADAALYAAKAAGRDRARDAAALSLAA